MSDAAAVNACCQFADDQRCMVEPACGAALAGAAYDADGVNMGVSKFLEANPEKEMSSDVVVIACGGNIVSREMMDEWSR